MSIYNSKHSLFGDTMIKYLSKFSYVLAKNRKSIIWLMTVFITSSLLEVFGISLIAPFLWLVSKPEVLHQNWWTNKIYSDLGFSSTYNFIIISGIALIFVFCFKSFLYFSAQSYINYFSFSNQGQLISRLLTAYLSVPYTFYLNRDTSSIIKNIFYETQNFCFMCMIPLLQFTSNIIAILVLLILLAKTDLLLLVILSIILLPMFLIFYYLKGQSRKWGQDESEAYHDMIRTVNNGLGGIKETYVFGCQPYFLNEMNIHVNKYTKSKHSFVDFQTLPRIIMETLLIVFTVIIVLIYQIFLSHSLESLLGVLSIFAAASIRLMPALSQSLSAIGTMQTGSYALDMLYSDLKNISQSMDDRDIKVQHSKILFESNCLSSRSNLSTAFTCKTIDIKNISYKYPNSTITAISNIYLTINKGQSIAFIGKSGSGKTTLIDIILGLLEAEEGDILTDGISIYEDMRSWQNLIAYIPQSIFLIDDTVEKNIAFGVHQNLIDSQKIDKCIQASQLTELIEQMPNGVKTKVGERGIRLSGGQRQRIGIARALYHEREILVLDEATSALDNETESLVTEAIKSLTGTKTIIIIAHRLTTIEHCDRIYLMEQGQIVKSGTYQEMLGREASGEYRILE